MTSALNGTIPTTPFYSQHDCWSGGVALLMALLQSDIITQYLCERESIECLVVLVRNVGAHDVDANFISNIYSYI